MIFIIPIILGAALASAAGVAAGVDGVSKMQEAEKIEAAYAAGQGTLILVGLFGTASTGAAIGGLSYACRNFFHPEGAIALGVLTKD